MCLEAHPLHLWKIPSHGRLLLTHLLSTLLDNQLCLQSTQPGFLLCGHHTRFDSLNLQPLFIECVQLCWLHSSNCSGSQVLDIVYFSNTTTPGGFFPHGVTGMCFCNEPFETAAAMSSKHHNLKCCCRQFCTCKLQLNTSQEAMCKLKPVKANSDRHITNRDAMYAVHVN